MKKMDKQIYSKCRTCWKSFIWACPLLLNIPKNIISCSAHEPTDVCLVISGFLKKLKKGYKDHFEIGKFEKYKYAFQSLQKWFELIIEECEEKIK